MTYQPLLPIGGIGGWNFLKRTLDKQQATFDKSAQMAREVKYFEENIGKAKTAADLVKDPILLKVALGAFGLGDEAFKKAYVRKALEEGTENEKAMANRIVDGKYRDLVGAFGYGDAKGAQVGDKAFVQKIVAQYRVRQFEEAVGAVDGSMRLAMNFDREAKRLSGEDISERAAWTRVLGDIPMRTVFEKALGLPKEFVKLDIDRQREVLEDKGRRLLPEGFKSLADPAVREKLIRTYLVRDQIDQFSAQSGPNMALMTLQNVSNNLRQSANLFQSRLR